MLSGWPKKITPINNSPPSGRNPVPAPGSILVNIDENQLVFSGNLKRFDIYFCFSSHSSTPAQSSGQYSTNQTSSSCTGPGFMYKTFRILEVPYTVYDYTRTIASANRADGSKYGGFRIDQSLGSQATVSTLNRFSLPWLSALIFCCLKTVYTRYYPPTSTCNNGQFPREPWV